MPHPPSTPSGPPLEPLARAGREVIKDSPEAKVEILGRGEQAVVVKTYRNRGLRLVQTFLRVSRAERERRNLQAVEAAGLPCTPPRGGAERRRLGFVLESTLITALVADATNLKAMLKAMPTGSGGERRALAAAVGRLLRDLHGKGLLWCTAMPRNVLVVGAAADARLALCDAPALVRWPGPVPRSATLIDLYDAAGSPSRRRDWSRAERFRILLAHAGGDRDLARESWRNLCRRSQPGHRLRKNLLMAVRTYILRPPTPADTSHTQR